MQTTNMQPEAIKSALKRAGFSQAEIAETCGVSRSIVCRVIDGSTTSHRVRCEIAKAISKDVKDIWEVQANPHKRGPRRTKFKPRQLG